MTQMMDVPLYGIVENMAYFKCDACDKEHSIFGVSGIDKISKEYNIPVIGRLPIDTQIASICDKGLIELYEGEWLEQAADHLENN